MKSFVAVAFIATSLAGCAGDQITRVTTTSPPKCFYDSNSNRQRCSNALAYTGYASTDHRAYRHNVNTANPLTNAVYGGGAQRPPGYQFGYDARFEAGYRSASRFDTTLYDKEMVR